MILNEAITTASGKKATWSFELECLVPKEEKFYSQITAIIAPLSGFLTQKGVVTDPNEKHGGDGSVTTESGDIPEEMISPRIKKDYNPHDLKRIIYQIPAGHYKGVEIKFPIMPADAQTFVTLYNILKKLFMARITINASLINLSSQPLIKEKMEGMPLVYVNETCGFHIHTGLNFDKKFIQEMLWVYCNMLADYNNFKKFFSPASQKTRFFFTDDDYASSQLLSIMNERLRGDLNLDPTPEEFKSRFFNIIERNFSNILEKFNVVRLHTKYGTFEWRGPRKFLTNNKEKFESDVKEILFTTVRSFIENLNKYSLSTYIVFDEKRKYIITKKEFFDKMSNLKGPEMREFDASLKKTLTMSKVIDTEENKKSSTIFSERTLPGDRGILTSDKKFMKKYEFRKLFFRIKHYSTGGTFYRMYSGAIKAKHPYEKLSNNNFEEGSLNINVGDNAYFEGFDLTDVRANENLELISNTLSPGEFPIGDFLDINLNTAPELLNTYGNGNITILNDCKVNLYKIRPSLIINSDIKEIHLPLHTTLKSVLLNCNIDEVYIPFNPSYPSSLQGYIHNIVKSTIKRLTVYIPEEYTNDQLKSYFSKVFEYTPLDRHFNEVDKIRVYRSWEQPKLDGRKTIKDIIRGVIEHQW